jgi:hypothetical protein
MGPEQKLKMNFKFKITPGTKMIILLMTIFLSIQSMFNSSSSSSYKSGNNKINVGEDYENYEVVEIETRYYFMGVPVLNAVFSLFTKMFTSYSVTHSYNVIKVDIDKQSNSYAKWGLQMTSDGVEMDGYWWRVKSLDEQFAGSGIHIVYTKRTWKTRKGTTLGDIKKWAQEQCENYCTLGNNCQDFSTRLYYAF